MWTISCLREHYFERLTGYDRTRDRMWQGFRARAQYYRYSGRVQLSPENNERECCDGNGVGTSVREPRCQPGQHWVLQPVALSLTLSRYERKYKLCTLTDTVATSSSVRLLVITG